MVVFNNIIAGASGATSGAAAGYEIERSLRFNSADSAYLSRGSFANSDTKTMTFSFWLKRSAPTSVTATQYVFSGGDNGTFFFASGNSDKLSFNLRGTSGTNFFTNTEAELRDFSAWYHIVVALDLDNATTSERFKCYINGVLQAMSSTSYPNNNFHDGGTWYIGSYTGTQNYPDFYLADFHYIAGQALAPTDFGEYDDNNVWQPKAYSGSYGTNGFRLDFSDNSSSAALGDDSSGNNNDWTVNNISASTVNYSSGGNDSSLTNYSFRDLFDKSLTTGAYLSVGGSGSTVRYTFPSAISGSIRFYGSTGGGAANNTANCATITLSTGQTFDFGPYSSSNPAWSTTWTVSNLQYVDLFGQNIPGNSDGLWLRAIELDGVLLTDSFLTDSLIDTPTNYEAASGNNGGNYCTLNPLANSGNTLSNGNLQIVTSSSTSTSTLGTFGVSSGKWYYEVQATSVSGTYWLLAGFSTENNINSSTAYLYQNDGTKYNNGSSTSYGSALSVNDYLGVALDLDAGTITFYINGVSQGTAFSSIPAGTYLPLVGEAGGAANSTQVLNFGQRPFAYTPPTGYLSLCTQNLTDPTIADGSTAMDVALYTGNGTSQSITGLGFSPDLVWIKSRSKTNYEHKLVDAVRGNTKTLRSSTTGAEFTNTDQVTSLNSDGFSLGADNTAPGGLECNELNNNYVAWTWDGGTSTVSNTDGSITSSVRANPSAGFSIATYTGNGTSGATIGHGLNAAPEFFVVKCRNTAATGWLVYAKPLGATSFLQLESTAAVASNATAWNNTAPSSTTITLGNSAFSNGNTQTYVCYAFAPVEGYSAFGSYTGNGSADGPFVYTGFRVRYLLQKRTDSSGSWAIKDAAREPYNVVDTRLYADSANADMQQTSFHEVDFLSNGFKVRSPGGAEDNASGGAFIYAAFAEHPFKTARAR